MERDIAQLVVGAKKPIVIPVTEDVDPETGCPDVKLDLDTEVDDKYKQLDIKKLQCPTKTHPDFRHCLPPTKVEYGKDNDLFSAFTVGSIEMGSAIQWQRELVKHLKDLPIIVTDPRRGHWNLNINAKKDDREFFDQVKWELDSLTRADVIVVFFDCNTSSPVTLLELGLWVQSGKVIVCCDQRYWRQPNISIVCERYEVPLVSSFHHLVPALREFMRLKGLEKDKVTGEYPKFPKAKADAELKELERSITQNKANKGDKDKQWWADYQDTEEETQQKMARAEKEKEEAAGEISEMHGDAKDAVGKEERRKNAEEALCKDNVA
ncbi:hypothetical protein HBH98_252620 [Parastagonospora nodorum]|nr:hypothetical protein HBH53_259300 [Parastagonospora nodorum]KAH3956031.1 hypothetical protein HBH51_257650 [Parastagonospora nodorum]KAH4215360.1 hypothetical protein HBI06_255040 [Parastagonospora nodorum]KAH4223040.1 hypothetical protein HBI05_252340 [Parastagonospora nodorum]KAH4332786.1 hypothetical protein HBH98_252620 [Parastagonospora nodorum]